MRVERASGARADVARHGHRQGCAAIALALRAVAVKHTAGTRAGAAYSEASRGVANASCGALHVARPSRCSIRVERAAGARANTSQKAIDGAALRRPSLYLL